MRLALASLSFAMALVLAQAARAGDTVTGVEARARFDEGIALARQGDFERARLKFKEVYAIEPATSVLLNLAICEKNTERPVDALEHLEEYLRRPGIDPAKARQVESELAAPLRKQTAKLTVTAPDGSSVILDGKRTLGTAPLKDAVIVLPGTHHVAAAGHEMKVEIPAGETVRAILTGPDTAPKSAPTPAPSSTALTSASPDTVVPLERDERPAAGWIVPIALGAGGLIAAGVGIGFASAAQSKRDEIDALPPGACADKASAACQARQAAIDDKERATTSSFVSYAIGGTLVVGAVATWFLWPKSRVRVSTNGREVGVVGAF